MCGGRKIVCDVVLRHVPPMNYIQIHIHNIHIASNSMHDAYVICVIQAPKSIQNKIKDKKKKKILNIVKNIHIESITHANSEPIQKIISSKIYSCLLISYPRKKENDKTEWQKMLCIYVPNRKVYFCIDSNICKFDFTKPVF